MARNLNILSKIGEKRLGPARKITTFVLQAIMWQELTSPREKPLPGGFYFFGGEIYGHILSNDDPSKPRFHIHRRRLLEHIPRKEYLGNVPQLSTAVYDTAHHV